MSLDGYQVAVPSHHRAEVCNRTTLHLLATRGVPASRVRVFVTAGQLAHYRATLDPGLYAELVAGAPGVAAQRNRIARYYPPGCRLVQVDDDVADVVAAEDRRHLAPVADLDWLLRVGFALAHQAGAGLWGLYPVANAYFMRPGHTTDLRVVLGGLFGTVNTRASWATVRCSQKDDYERTLRWWCRHGAVVRLSWVAVRTRMYSPGGMQAPGYDRQAANEPACAYLLATWPDLVRVAARRGPCGTELRLVSPRKEHAHA